MFALPSAKYLEANLDGDFAANILLITKREVKKLL